ncbi:hypothetical protein CVT25_005113 [Psilocybe cyanescens]|uniref:Uncharacterized protein n=1 Tax=Psilocybe cyanescens TaxID=93625 RepID=A0A409XE58_PSICY|nr:hypothetical protein CVT25_005113 [Psilocybe cyanescens]
MGSNLHTIFCVFALVLVLLESCNAVPLSLPQPGTQCMLDYCPKYFANFPPRGRRAPSPTIEFKTNAQRLAGGIPLKPPMFRVKNAAPWKRAPAPPPLPRASLASSSNRVPTVRHCGVVALKNETGDRVGYIGSTPLESGYIYLNESLSSAVTVCFTTREGRVRARNVPFFFGWDWDLHEDFPLLGLVQGGDNNGSDIGPLSPHYLTFAGVKLPATPPLSPPVPGDNTFSFYTGLPRDVESSVWSVNIQTGNLIAQWTNANGTQPDTHIFSIDNVLYAGGDLAAFGAFFTATIVPLTLQFIPW